MEDSLTNELMQDVDSVKNKWHEKINNALALPLC